MKKLDRTVAAKSIITIIVAAGWISFEAFQITSTFESIGVLFGGLAVMHKNLFVVGMAALDFGGLLRLTTPRINGEDRMRDLSAWAFYCVWFIVAMLNAIFTWWILSIRVGAGAIETPPGIPSSTVALVVPMTVSCVVLLIRVGLTMAVGHAMETWVADSSVAHSSRASFSSARKPAPGTQQAVLPLGSLNNASSGHDRNSIH